MVQSTDLEPDKREAEPVKRDWFIIIFAGALLAAAIVIYLALAYVGLTPRNRLVDEMAATLDNIYAKKDLRSPHTYLLEKIFAEDRRGFTETGLLHIALGFMIAAILLLFVETHMRNRLMRERAAEREQSRRERIAEREQHRQERIEDKQAVAQDVWKAVSGRLVHSSVSEEIDNILKSTVCKYDVRYKITLCTEPYVNVPPGFIVVRRELSYSLLNMLGRPVTHNIPSLVVSHTKSAEPLRRRDGAAVSLPCHLALRVNGKDIQPQPTDIQHPVDLEANDQAQHDVEIVTEELLRETDRNTYVTLSLNIKTEIQVVNELRDVIRVTRVDFLHPTPKLFKEKGKGSFRWEFQGSMLPGQGFIVTWERLRAEPKDEAELPGPRTAPMDQPPAATALVDPPPPVAPHSVGNAPLAAPGSPAESTAKGSA